MCKTADDVSGWITGIDRKTIRKYHKQFDDLKANVCRQTTGTAESTPDQIPASQPLVLSRLTTSICEPYREFIEAQLRVKRNYMSIYQDLVDRHGFAGAYNSVKRFAGGLYKHEPEQFDRLDFAPGEEAQVDYGEGALTRVAGTDPRPCSPIHNQTYRVHSEKLGVTISGTSLIAGHKGHPGKIIGRKARRNRPKGARGRGTLASEKPPIFGMIQRNGDVRIEMLQNVQQATIRPFIEQTVKIGTLVYTDEYVIYSALVEWGYEHKTVCHGAGEYARDEDGDGFHEVHVNTMEGFWSLLRSWLRPHRGISQEKLPIYLSFFEFVHNERRRGRALLGSFLETLLQSET